MAKIFGKRAKYYDGLSRFLRINYPIVEKEMRFKGHKKILDVGGGTGRIAKRIVDVFDAEVTILDPALEMLEVASKDANIKKINKPIENNFLESSSFDIIICTNALHHFKEPKKGLEEMFRLLKPKGQVFIQDFDSKKKRTKILQFIEKRFMGEPGNFYSQEDLERLLEKIGFKGTSKPILDFQYLYIGKK